MPATENSVNRDIFDRVGKMSRGNRNRDLFLSLRIRDEMAIIRALAFHAPNYNRSLTRDYFDDLLRFTSAFKRTTKSFKTNIWTKRMVLPRSDVVGNTSLYELAQEAQDAAKALDAQLVALPLGKVKAEDLGTQISDSFRDTSTSFFSIKAADIEEDLSNIDVISLAALIKQIAKNVGPESCSRFAVAYGGQPETAYFPDTASKKEGFSISSRYVPDLSKCIKKHGARGIESAMREIFSKLNEEAKKASVDSGLDYIGLDASISPWMDESIALLIAELIEDEFGGPGTYHAVHALNSEMLKASRSMRTGGFNEIMLPVGEDDELKRLASKGQVDLNLLVSLISVCVAGLDMVVLPLSTPDKKLAKLLLDVFSIAQRRKKQLGVRILLADDKPGNWVKLGRFGSAPVMSI